LCGKYSANKDYLLALPFRFPYYMLFSRQLLTNDQILQYDN